MPSKKKKKKSEKKKNKPSAVKLKPRKTVAAPKRKLVAKPIVVAAVLPIPPLVISYDMIAERAFLIWERKTHTNYPEQNWIEAEAELRAELNTQTD